jgi:hypothetical protein
MLLRLESVHVHWKLSGSHNIGQKNKFPALKLSPIAKIEIFSEGIMLPASTFFNTCAPPEAGGSIEIEKAATPATGGLLEQKMPIEKNCLHAREKRITAIQMPPSGLDHSYLRIGKKMDRAV